MKSFKNNPIVKKLGFNRIILFCILLLMYGVFSILIPGFAGMARIMSIFNYVYFLGFLALGVTFVIATGGIDFSIGPVMFCCALMAGYSMNTYGAPVIVSILMSIAIGLCFGTFNGYLVAFVGVPPFIVSMATMNIAKGLGSVFTQTQSVSWPQGNDPSGKGWFRGLVKIGDIPTGLILFAVAVVILFFVMNNTKAGRYILCLGSNKEAVRLSGVNVRKWQMLAYMICGMCAGVAGMIASSRIYSADSNNIGLNYEMYSILAVALGGNSLAGGKFNLAGSIVGAYTIQAIMTTLLAMGVSTDQSPVIMAIIIILIVVFQSPVFKDWAAAKKKNKAAVKEAA